MKCIIVLAIVAVLASSGEAVRCADVASCTPDTSQFKGGSRDDIQRACTSVRKAIDCFREAMHDCRETGNIPEATIRSLEDQIDIYDRMLNGHCGSSGANGLKGSMTSSLTVLCVVLFLAAIFM